VNWDGSAERIDVMVINQMKVGIISDTHGLLRSEVVKALMGCDAILHGGDINRQEILDQLNTLAPVYVVRGNNDKEWAEHLPLTLDFTLTDLRIFMTHKKKDLPEDLSMFDLVVYGHSHKYAETYMGKTLLLNPGSCGPRRFHQASTMAIVEYTNDSEGNKTLHVTRIDIPHDGSNVSLTPVSSDLLKQIQTIMRETDKGYSIAKISERHGFKESQVEQIVRLYLTHTGVTAEGILNKMML
jgi:putative phosphoesterase